MAGRYGVSLELHDKNYRINYSDAIDYRRNLTLREFINVLETDFECIVISFRFNNLRDNRIFEEAELNLDDTISNYGQENTTFEVLVRSFQNEPPVDLTNPVNHLTYRQYMDLFRIIPFEEERKNKLTELRLNASRAYVTYRNERKTGNSRRAMENASKAFSDASKEFELFQEQYKLYLTYLTLNESRLLVKTFVSRLNVLDRPVDITVDDDGNLFACNVKNKIVKITKEGVVSVIAGTGERGNKNGAAMEATFKNPEALCCHKGNLYIADGSNHSIRVLTPDNQVKTFVQFEAQHNPEDIWVMDDETLGVWNEDQLFTVKLDGTATHIEEAGENEYERYQVRGTEDSLGNKYYVGVDGGNLKIKGRDGRIKTFGSRLNEGETLLDGPLELLKYSVNMDGFAYDKITKRVYFCDGWSYSIRMIVSIAEIFRDIAAERAVSARGPALMARSRFWAELMRRPASLANNKSAKNGELLKLVAKHANSSSANQVLKNMLPPAVSGGNFRRRGRNTTKRNRK